MRRRDFIARLGGVMLLAPLAARGQQGPAALIGYLGSSSFDSSERQLVGFRQGLAEASFKEGQNLAVEYRWSDGDYIRLPAMTTELLSRGGSLILASGLPAALAAKAAT